MIDSFLSDPALRQPPEGKELPPSDPFVEDPKTTVFSHITHSIHSKTPSEGIKSIQKDLGVPETGLFDEVFTLTLAEILGVSRDVVQKTKYDSISLVNQVRKYLGNR